MSGLPRFLHSNHHRIACLCGLLAIAPACHRQTFNDYVSGGEADLKAGRLPQATIQFRNALRLNPRRADIRFQLGDIYVRLNAPLAALGMYERGAELLPDDIDAQMKTGNLHLLAGHFREAQARAARALELEPKNVAALLLQGNALAGLKDLDGGADAFARAIRYDPSASAAYINLGTVQVAQGKRDAAESTFKRAVESAPRSLAAQMALANFYLSSGRLAIAEATFKAALSIDPANVEVNRTLGTFYLATGRSREAEPYFRALASGSAFGPRLTLAQYYVSVKRFDAAREILQGLASSNEFSTSATVRLAALDAAEGKKSEAAARVAEVLAKEPKDPQALLVKANLLWLNHKNDEAIAAAQLALAADRKSANAHTTMGRLYEAVGKKDKARSEYEQGLALDPQSYSAAVGLARLFLAVDKTEDALTYAERATVIQPSGVEAHELLAQVSLRRGDDARATSETALVQRAAPATAESFDLVAALERSRKHPSAAREAYLHALELDPSDLQAIGGLAQLDLAAGDAKAAAARINSTIQHLTPTADLLLLGARTAIATNDASTAETFLQRAIAIDPDRLESYVLLGDFYLKRGQAAAAAEQFQSLVRRNPSSVPAGTIVGLLLEAQGKQTAAEDAYKHVLSVDSRAAVAANNLAYLYAVRNGNLDDAVQYGRVAHQQMPDDPHVNDTLGWIYSRRKTTALAIPLLEFSASKLPNNPAIHYHLGMTYLQAHDFDKAHDSLTRALALGTDFEGAADAKAALASLGK
jgi:tetratricopeptide (TPR) repeat protein